MNKHNKIYIVPVNYQDAANFDRLWKRYITEKRHCYDYKKDIPKNVQVIFLLKFFPDSGDLEYYQRIK